MKILRHSRLRHFFGFLVSGSSLKITHRISASFTQVHLAQPPMFTNSHFLSRLADAHQMKKVIIPMMISMAVPMANASRAGSPQSGGILL
ncbi:MAG TPA: hypothetical protein VG796_04700 [Verrucomicrobiales bacterium]|nr:hypothetical protein [Verrucomicrobiales bacterium]